ncbi:metal-dependent phosphohydrolase [Massilia sp. Root351]|jgi:putative nucleotidyltransferase with HDIG domain|uniref:HD-GYP domain-containing protein n=1 Tax=Massilia sp. Root351 TaxID=1736522 RepID=UPI00070DF33D|nr:HD-GYP domain-containing protein [Massilia sp. Root351]KQV79502.1 metal-dependent phosphohydrolase [Massilia sp. Root351]
MDQLRVGLYVELDLKWFEHPFAFSHFKIKSEDQISTLRSLGLPSVRYKPELSDVAPQEDAQAATASGKDAADSAAAVAAAAAAAAASPALQAKRAMLERMQLRRADAERVERAFTHTARAIREIEKHLFSRPEESVKQATGLVTQITDAILCAPELAIHVMGDTAGNEELYFHSLNVTMLSMMIAREVNLPPEVANLLGLGALLHDIGRKNIPDKILSKPEPYTTAEQNLYEMHAQYGAEMAQRLQCMPAVAAVIHDHHELFDGSGYPRKLKGEGIGVLARIVAIANYYDELCNPFNLAHALTPHEALSMMFAKHRAKFDPRLLQMFIRCLGVYPPGTVVQLSNGMTGMVATVNTARPMKPMVVVYDKDVPRLEAIMVDLDLEPELNIVKALRPGMVPPEVYVYLSPRKRVSYYFDASKPAPQTAAA